MSKSYSIFLYTYMIDVYISLILMIYSDSFENNIVWLFQRKSCDPTEQILHYIEGGWEKKNYCRVV